jgi:alkylhydroperoxidase/carboxymuconolactone decarboxylase family protein YurZ
MTSFWKYTRRDKIGGIDGLNLFFGALLGANLGTLDGLLLPDYINVIVVLAGTVMTIRMLTVSERRWMMLATLVLYGAVLYAVVTIPALKPKGLADADLHRLVATVVVWIVFVLATEFWPVADPVTKESSPASGDDGGQA